MKLLFIFGENCIPCQRIKVLIPRWENMLIDIDTGKSMCEIEQIDAKAADVSKWNLKMTPTFILCDDEYNELHRFDGVVPFRTIEAVIIQHYEVMNARQEISQQNQS